MKKRFLIGVGILLALLLMVYLFLRPQLRVLAGYVAKNACSCAYVLGTAEERIRSEDVGYGLLQYASFELDVIEKSATSAVYGLAKRKAVYRGDLGCVLLPESATRAQQLMPRIEFPAKTTDGSFFPYSEAVSDTLLPSFDSLQIQKAVQAGFETVSTRAILVIKDGHVIAEKYRAPFNEDSKHLGWSMTKSLTNAMIGILVKQGKLSLDQDNLMAAWKGTARAKITLNDLLQMNSGLAWEENYAKVCNATEMLFEEAAMGVYAAAQDMETTAGEKWYYSSGTSNLLSEIIRRQFDSDEAYWNFPQKALFDNINASSFRIEADAGGTYVGSSYSYATARDWAKFGLLYLNDGYWQETQILPTGWVDYTKTVAPNSNGAYGAHFWLNQGGAFPDAPKDLYYCSGFNGQYVFIVPSQNMVVVRLGVDGLGEMDANQLLRDILKGLDS